MAEHLNFDVLKNRSHTSRARISLLLVVALFIVLFVPSGNGEVRPIRAAPLALTFEATAAGAVSLGSLASRSQCGAMTKQGVGPYTMSGTDSRSGLPYSYVTDRNNTGAQLNESGIAPSSMSYTRTPGSSFAGKSGVLRLSSTGSISWSNSCSGRSVYGSAFGPEVYTAPFQATEGQALSFNWAAQYVQDDYEIYAFLVKVSPAGASYDYGGSGSTLLSNTTLLTHGRGQFQNTWKTSTGVIPADGYYRFRFVNGSYDASGGFALGATMYIDPEVLVGQANSISFGALSDRVTSSSSQTFTITASATSGGPVTFTSSTTTRCTVGSSTAASGVSTATVTLISNATGLCTLTADSASVGDYATAGSVSRSFNILSAPTAPSYSGGTSVTGSASVGLTLTAADGSWGDGGSPITSTGYQWQICPTPSSCVWGNVSGATTSTYLVGSSDVGKQVRVLVTKTNNIGSTSSTSSASATIAKGTQASLSLTSVSATYGSTLQLTTSGGSGGGSVSFAVVTGTCSITADVLTPGDAGSHCVVRATKAADSSFNVATSADTAVTVNKATQVALQVTSLNGTFGTTLSLSTIGGSGTGAVTYAVVSGACEVSGSSVTPTAAGSSCVVRATKATDSNYVAVSSVDTVLTFSKGDQAPLIITSITGTYGSTLTLTTSGGSGVGPVTFSVSSGSCSVSGSSLTLGNAGSSCSVVANKASDDNYTSISSSSTSISTAKSVQSAISISDTTTTYGQELVLGTTGGSGSGAISYSVVSGTCTIVGALLNPGNAGSSCVIKATKASDTNYLERSTSNTTITIGKAQQSGLSVTSAAAFTTGSTLTLSATGGQSTGSLSWSLNSGNCVLSGANLTASRGGISCVVEVNRAGDNNYFSTSTTQTIAVEKLVQTLTFRSTPPSSPVVGGTYTVQIESDASLASTIVISNTSTSVCSISAGVVTFSSAGTCIISASQAGSDVYAAAAASQSITVAAVPVTTTVPPASSGTGTATNTSTTTIPQSAVPAPVSTSSTTTTTTTTTTIPSDPGSPNLVDGEFPELAVGEATAVVRGQEVKVVTATENGQLTLTLPGNVVFKVGTTNSASGEAQVGSDGKLRMYGDTTLSVAVNGFVPKTTYTVFMFSDPLELGRGETSAAGSVEDKLLVPDDVEPGEHTLQFNGVGPGNEVISLSMGFEVMDRQSNTRIAILVIALAIALALLGGRPIFKRRRTQS
jgi:hypothetical protein